jgi:peptidoglycan/LPS O-acetylase OafA/YrhL
MNAENSIHLISEKSMSSRVHLKVLDGWRGLSILLVLASHLLPLGPKNLQLNMSVGILGMVLFFNLSGFLITSFLLEDRNIQTFLIRRFFRVIPLAWLYLAIALAFSSASIYSWMAHYLFYANLPPVELVTLTEHIWSLCAEVQFYVGVAILVSILKVRSLFLLPIFGLLFTALRIWNGIPASSITYYRIDEILAGCTLALIYHGQPRHFLKNLIRQMPQLPILILVVFSCMPQGRWLNYFRPYLAAALIGTTILREDSSLARWLEYHIPCTLYIHYWRAPGWEAVMYMKSMQSVHYCLQFYSPWPTFQQIITKSGLSCLAEISPRNLVPTSLLREERHESVSPCNRSN